MLSEIVKVTSVEAEQLHLQAVNSSTCNSCSVKPSCGQYLLNSLYAQREVELPKKLIARETDIQLLKKGSKFQINIAADKLVQIALLMYFLPLFGMLLVAYLTELAGLGEEIIIVLVFISLFVILRILSRFLSAHNSIKNISLHLLADIPEK